jgi:organic radical activating enzyme/phage gpG-like protein
MSKEQDREKYYLSLNDDDNLAKMEFSFHTNDFIDNEIKEQKTLGNIKTNYEELKYRFYCEWLQSLNKNQFDATKHLELHYSDYINSRVKRAKDDGTIYDNATELKYRLVFEECEKYKNEKIDFTISMMYLCGDIDFMAQEPFLRKVISEELKGEREKFEEVGLYEYFMKRLESDEKLTKKMFTELTSEYIETRIKEIKKRDEAYHSNKKLIKDVFDELKCRLKLQECELITSDFIEQNWESHKNMDYYMNPHNEYDKRAFFQSEEEAQKELKRRKSWFGKIDNDPEFANKEFTKISSPHIESEIKELKKLGKLQKPSEEMKHRLYMNTLHQIDNSPEMAQKEFSSHTSPYIEKEIEKYKKEGMILSFSEELRNRITLEECEKHSSEFIDSEINKLKEQGKITSPGQELEQRTYFEVHEHQLKNQKEIIYDDSEMFDKKSLHGLKEINWLKKKLNEIGRGFCLAKWNQVTILLQSGMTHSCHHPIPHKIPLTELADNPTALHNTQLKKRQRKLMLEGKRPPECDYCWAVEDSNPESFSDRHLKSGEGWAFPDFKKIENSNWMEDVNPPYVEISFSNKCNMRCMYCDVKSSSRWQSEIKSKGPYKTSGYFNNTTWLDKNNMMPIPYGDNNPYIEAFMKWWPELYRDLHTFRITGGEPLLHEETFQILDYIIVHHEENPRLELSINSNCSVPDEVFDRFIEKVKIITDNNMVWNFSLFTSIEADGEQAEYIRDGIDAERFWKNVDKFLTECEKPSATIMATYNILSIPSYHKVIQKVFDLKQKHYNGKRYRDSAILLDTAYLRQPEFQQARLISTDWIAKMKKDYQLMVDLSDEKYIHIVGHGHTGFYDFECEKLRRVIDWVEAPLTSTSWLIRQRKDFIKMYTEYDKRRDKNFLETFPEYKEFWENCESYEKKFSYDMRP